MRPTGDKADDLQHLAGKVEELEGKLNWQKERIARLVTSVDRVVDRLAKFEAAQHKAAPTGQRTAPPTKTSRTVNIQQTLETIKYYCRVAETVGQMIQVVAAALVLLLEVLQQKSKNPFPSRAAEGSGEDLNLNQLLHTVNEMLRGLTESGEPGGNSACTPGPSPG